MGKSIYRLLDEAYNRAKDCLEPLNEVLSEVAETMAALIFAIFIYGTLPIWVIPYKIAKKRKKPKPEENKVYREWTTPSDCNCRCSIHPTIPDETLSPETKQAVLDDFMKGVE